MYGKKTGKRLLSWVLMLIMALSMLPLNVLADEVGGTGRYVALVDFNTNATAADAGWQDVSTEAGHTAILTAINDLKPDGGTNLDDGLQNANLLFAKSNVQEIDSKNIIALTDGEPTYHMTKDIFGNPTVGGFGNSCTKEVFEATANTAASICNRGTTLYSICFGAANEEVKNPNTGAYISRFEYLNTYIALNKTYSANDFSGLKDAFDAIFSSITSGLSSGTVHDSLPDGVTCISGDFEGNWNLTGATGEPGEGGVTTYTYTKTYTVKIDPTAVDAEQYDGYYPLNGPTTLTVKGSNDEDVTIDFPIPAGKATLQKYNLTINYKYADGTEAKPTHTESLTYGSSYSVASPLITGYTADKLTVSGSMPDSDVTVDVTFTAKDYTVTYESNGGSTVPSQTVKYNETANKPADPTKSGYTFAGWYTEEKLTNKYDFAALVTGNITLYAKWTRNYTPRPYTPPTVVIPDDTLGLNTTDHFVYIVGYGNGKVRPQNNITRAEVATIFFRLLTDDVRDKNLTKTNRYSDVAATSWYNTAVSTLSSMGIITGYPDGTFGPQRDITRAETMTLVNRVLNRQPETEDDLLPNMTVWTDNASPKAWYYLAVQEATNSHYYKFKTNSKYEKWTELRETRDWTLLEK
ncbi:VWA domain-containing protein [Ruminococcaceae bacterium TF06-43]|nr:VWA domain-containing protein [Ruminococcaceae bacterium TF06-43]